MSDHGAPRNYSSWAYWRMRLERTALADPCPDDRPDELWAWRDRARERLGALLGPWPARVPPRLEVLDETRAGGVLRRSIVFDSEDLMSVPALMLIPEERETAAAGAAALAIHGHGLDKDAVCAETGYGHQLARRGLVVLAPDLRGFGERADRFFPAPPPGDLAADVVHHHFSCDWPLVCASMHGEHPLSLNLWDLRCALDVLAADPRVDPGRLGAVGWSYGGTLALFLAATDDRVRAAIVSCFFSSWRRAHTMPWNLCGSQVLTGMLGRIEHLDLAALVAPRALAVENAADDALFPVDEARREAARLARVYSALGAPHAFTFDVFPGDHSWRGGASVEAFVQALGATPG